VADAVIDVVGMDELPLIVEMYNQIFRPARNEESFRRRYLGRHNVLQMVARVKDKPAGFFLGFELKPDTFFAWFYGVVPDFRRMGIGSQLMEAAQSWAAQQGYDAFRLECHNGHRPMLHLAIELGYDVIGLRWDADRGDNLVMFEKGLGGGR
jgi:GNAT superfamily N-acetyltransferase